VLGEEDHVEPFDHLDLPGREPKPGHALESVDVGITDEAETEPVRRSPVREADELVPQVDRMPRERRQREFGFKFLAPLVGPRSVAQTFDVLSIFGAQRKVRPRVSL